MRVKYNEHSDFVLARSAREVEQVRGGFLRDARRDAWSAPDAFARDHAQHLLCDGFALNQEALYIILAI